MEILSVSLHQLCEQQQKSLISVLQELLLPMILAAPERIHFCGGISLSPQGPCGFLVFFSNAEHAY